MDEKAPNGFATALSERKAQGKIKMFPNKSPGKKLPVQFEWNSFADGINFIIRMPMTRKNIYAGNNLSILFFQNIEKLNLYVSCKMYVIKKPLIT